MMQPYWSNEQHGLSIYHGDSEQILAALEPDVGAVITDPPWPGAAPTREWYPTADALIAKWRTICRLVPRVAVRMVVHLGCDTEPGRMLAEIPARMPFVRVCWLRYARPHHKNRILYGADVAYVYGQPPRRAPGRQILPGEYVHTDSTDQSNRQEGFPCARKLSHVRWLVEKWSDAEETVYDPFCGSGTTLAACYHVGRAGVGIEREERYCEIAATRLEDEMVQGHLLEITAPAPKPVQTTLEVEP